LLISRIDISTSDNLIIDIRNSHFYYNVIIDIKNDISTSKKIQLQISAIQLLITKNGIVDINNSYPENE